MNNLTQRIKHILDNQKVMVSILGVLTLLLIIFKFALPNVLIKPLPSMDLRFADALNWFFVFIKDDLGFNTITRGFAFVTEWLINITSNLLYGKNRWPRLNAIPWTMIAATAFVIGYVLNGWRLALISGGTFIWVALMGQWKWAMETLSVIVVATPFSVLFGLILGILAWKFKKFERVLNPLLNIAQSLPHFSYMIPVVIFIGVGPKAGAIVTVIFATPPMIRMCILGLKKVAPEIVESGQMCGANKWQMLKCVWIPSARTEILIGVNQVIMQCLAMVVLASFIGMPGLGQKLLQLLQALKIGRSIEIGITIVLIAVMLDRCSKAWAYNKPKHFEKNTVWWKKYKFFILWGVLIAISYVAMQFTDLAYEIKRSDAFTLSKDIDFIIDQTLMWLGPYTYALRAFLIQYILIPIRDFYLWLPYSAVLLFIATIGWAVGGKRSAGICFAFFFFIALTPWWDRAMITLYTICFSILIAAIIGFPLGIWGAQKEKRATRVLLICDTAQTFPSFIYLIPVVILFGVNDVAVIFAIIVFAMVPFVRYTIEGLRNVPLTLIEAANMSGATKWQSMLKVKLPLAMPTIMVGVNQSVLFSLFMVIIAAFIGTVDLGQEMQRALSSTDVGKGMVLGLCVAFMGLMADHLIILWSSERKKILGID